MENNINALDLKNWLKYATKLRRNKNGTYNITAIIPVLNRKYSIKMKNVKTIPGGIQSTVKGFNTEHTQPMLFIFDNSLVSEIKELKN